jgi:hypothetical protein
MPPLMLCVQVEHAAVDEELSPLEPCLITDCGQLPSDFSLAAFQVACLPGCTPRPSDCTPCPPGCPDQWLVSWCRCAALGPCPAASHALPCCPMLS